MESSEIDKAIGSGDDVHTLTRNRSFKTKQLVRSQAIRESQSPPRTSPPNIDASDATDRTLYAIDKVNSSHSNSQDKGLKATVGDDVKLRPVEIQITSNSWDNTPDRQISRQRWPGHKPDYQTTKDYQTNAKTDLLSNSPRVSCVCGGCRTRQRTDDGRIYSKTECGCQMKKRVPAKQDSGIVCSDEGPDYSDSENNDPVPPRSKADSTDADHTENTGLCRCTDRKDRPKLSYLNRTDSDEKNELSEDDLVLFVKETLNKNMKDRLTLLKIEKELHSLVTDYGRTLVRFPVMTSYGRMLVHRVAALFQLTHHTDLHNKNAVLVTKMGTSGGRLPCTNFRDWCVANLPTATSLQEMQAKSILRRDAHSLDDNHGNNNNQGYPGRSKSLEQREKEYQRVRRKIFSDNNGQEQWPWTSTAPIKLLTPEGGRNKLHKVQSLESSTPSQQPRGSVAKSHSFGGYDPQPTRVLSRQGDLASSSWRVSPSSSGYKTLSLRSTDSVTPSPTGGISPEPITEISPPCIQQPLVWACTDIASVPAGALIIHPQTGRPLINTDGSLYQYDPSNPPIFHDVTGQVPDDKSDQNSEKKRGRLEKQHSFMENEYDNQLEEYNNNKEYCCNDDWTEKPADNAAYDTSDKESNQQQFEQPVEPQNNYEQVESAIPTETEHLEQNEYNDVNYHDNQIQEVKEEEIIEENLDTEDKDNSVLYEDPNAQMQATDYAACPTAYTYPNQCQMEPQYYTQMEEPKMSNQNIEEPFRIDQSYPYATQPIADISHIQTQYIGVNNQYMTNGYHLNTCAGSCGFDPTTGLVNCTRSYPVPYAQNIETGVIPAGYPLTNVLLSQTPVHPYTYAPSIQYPMLTPALPAACSTPVQKPQSPPNIYIPQTEIPVFHQPVNYPMLQYGNIPYQYPVAPVLQQYPICSQIYPVTGQDRRNSGVRNFDSAQKFNSKKNSTSGSSGTTPLPVSPPAPENKPSDNKDTLYKDNTVSEASTDDSKPKSLTRTNSVRSDISRQSPPDLNVNIQQVTQRVTHMSVSETNRYDRNYRNDRFRSYDDGRRNRNPGILGSYPANNFHNRIFNRTNINDESQLNSAARAIVHSIRQMHAKTVFPNETRRDYTNNYNSNYNNNNNYNNRFNNYNKNEYFDRNGRRDRNNTENNFGEQRQNTHQESNLNPSVERNNYSRMNHRPVNSVPQIYTPAAYNVFRQVAPNWCRRSPGPLTAAMPPRRPPLDRGYRRQ